MVFALKRNNKKTSFTVMWSPKAETRVKQGAQSCNLPRNFSCPQKSWPNFGDAIIISFSPLMPHATSNACAVSSQGDQHCKTCDRLTLPTCVVKSEVSRRLSQKVRFDSAFYSSVCWNCRATFFAKAWSVGIAKQVSLRKCKAFWRLMLL